jgi:hypothetical protein
MTELCRPRKDGTANGELLTRSQFMTENHMLINNLIINPQFPVPTRRLALVVENSEHPMGQHLAYPTLITGHLLVNKPNVYMKVHVGQIPGERRAAGPTSPSFRSPQKRRRQELGPDQGVLGRDDAIQNDSKFDAVLFVPAGYRSTSNDVNNLIDAGAIGGNLTRILEDRGCRVYFFPENPMVAAQVDVGPHIKCALCGQLHTPGLFCTNVDCPKASTKFELEVNRFRS